MNNFQPHQSREKSPGAAPYIHVHVHYMYAIHVHTYTTCTLHVHTGTLYMGSSGASISGSADTGRPTQAASSQSDSPATLD